MIAAGLLRERIFYGWVVVAGAFVVMGVGYGLIYSLGTYLEPFSREFGADRGPVSFVFGLAAILSLVGGIVAGPLADRFGPRPLGLAAAAAYLVGLGLASRATALWQLYLAIGLCAGGAVAAVYVPAVATVQRWFFRRRGLASAIATSGMGAGTLLGPLSASWLISGHGWRTAVLVSGLGAAALTAVAATLLVGRPERMGLAPDGGIAAGPAASATAGSTVREALRTPQFRWLYVAMIGTCAVAFFGYGHIVPYAEGRGLDPLTASLGLVSVGVGSWLGRLGLAPATDWLGHRRSFALAVLGLSAVMLAWLVLPVPPLASLLVVGFCLGTAFGVFVALCPTIIADQFGQRSLSAIIGALYTGAGVGSLLGPWLGGLTFDWTGSYRVANVAAAGAAVIAAAAILRAGAPRSDVSRA